MVSPEHEWQEARPIHERMLDLLLQPSQSFKTDQIPNVASRFSAQECAVIIKKARLLLAGEESLLYVAGRRSHNLVFTKTATARGVGCGFVLA